VVPLHKNDFVGLDLIVAKPEYSISCPFTAMHVNYSNKQLMQERRWLLTGKCINWENLFPLTNSNSRVKY